MKDAQMAGDERIGEERRAQRTRLAGVVCPQTGPEAGHLCSTRASITISGRVYLWTREAGLEAAAVETVEAWIRREAMGLECTARRRGMDLDDLLQSGRLGALEAAQAFDPEHNASFLAYARFRIRRRILEALGCGEDVKRPAREVRERAESPSVLRLEARCSEDLALGDTLPSQTDLQALAEQHERETALARAMATLSGQDRQLLELRYGLTCDDALTLEEIGARQQPPVGREPIRQRLLRAESRLRAALRAMGLAGTPISSVPSRRIEASFNPNPNPGTRAAERATRRSLRRSTLGQSLFETA